MADIPNNHFTSVNSTTLEEIIAIQEQQQNATREEIRLPATTHAIGDQEGSLIKELSLAFQSDQNTSRSDEQVPISPLLPLFEGLEWRETFELLHGRYSPLTPKRRVDASTQMDLCLYNVEVSTQTDEWRSPFGVSPPMTPTWVPPETEPCEPRAATPTASPPKRRRHLRVMSDPPTATAVARCELWVYSNEHGKWAWVPCLDETGRAAADYLIQESTP